VLGLEPEFSPAEFRDCLWSCLNPLTLRRTLDRRTPLCRSSIHSRLAYNSLAASSAAVGTATYHNFGFFPPRIAPPLTDVRSCMRNAQRSPVRPRIRDHDADCPRCLCSTRCVALRPNFDRHEMAFCRRLGWIAVITGPLLLSMMTENEDSAVVCFSDVGVADCDRHRCYPFLLGSRT